MQMMKAAVVEQPGVISIKNIPHPEVGDYHALCRMLCGTTCSGTDLQLLDGSFPWPVRYPTILGHESVGQVIATGKKVRGYTVGDLVTRVGVPTWASGKYGINWGGFAEYGIATDHWSMKEDGVSELHWKQFRFHQILPEHMNIVTGALFITWRETLSYLTRMGNITGKKILIVGSGGNGMAFANHAVNLAAAHVVMIGNPNRRQAAEVVKVKDFMDYRDNRLPNILSAICPEGFDYLIDTVGKKDSSNKVLRFLRNGGTLGIYGIDEYHSIAINPNTSQGNFTVYCNGYDEAETHEQVVAFIQNKKLKPHPYVTPEYTYPLEEIHEAMAAVRQRKTIKAIITLNPRSWR